MRISFLISIFFIISACNNKSTNKNETLNPKPKVILGHGNLTDFKTITFPSKDSLAITADLYLIKNSKNFILLCHQAGFSRAEYIESAKKLNRLGYSCMAIDQRSGKVTKNIINETAKLAKEKGLASKYLDAKPDIESAIDYAHKLNDGKIILVGSSYSAALSLLLATTNDKVKAVAAFSPGEYLKGVPVTESISSLIKPTFVTSSKKEIEQVTGIIKNVKSDILVQFKPEIEGIHGSRVLWSRTEGNASYWKAFTEFLSRVE